MIAVYRSRVPSSQDNVNKRTQDQSLFAQEQGKTRHANFKNNNPKLFFNFLDEQF